MSSGVGVRFWYHRLCLPSEVDDGAAASARMSFTDRQAWYT